MSKLTPFAQLKACMLKIKTYVNSLISSVANSAAEAIEELASLLDTKANLTYCTCSTPSSTAAKVAAVQSGMFELKVGASVDVKFSYYNEASSPTLNVNSTGAIAIKMYGTTDPNTYMWMSGAVVRFIYDGTYWIMQNETIATTSYYGLTKLSSSTSSTSTSLAATPYAVKAAYDLANTANTGVGQLLNKNSPEWLKEDNNEYTCEQRINLDDLHVADVHLNSVAGYNTINELAAVLDAHINNEEDPHNVTKVQVGLGNVDNTSDLNKPISTAVQAALDKKISRNGTSDDLWSSALISEKGWYRIASANNYGSAIIEVYNVYNNQPNNGVVFIVNTGNWGTAAPEIVQLSHHIACNITTDPNNVFPKCRAYVTSNGNNTYVDVYYAPSKSNPVVARVYSDTFTAVSIITKSDGSNIPPSRLNEFTFSDKGIKSDLLTATTVNATTVNSSGADGAELMEWADGNPDDEDRCGYFVALTGRKIRIANANDDLRKVSVISGNYSFLGNDYVDFWHGKYKKDVYGRRITRDIVYPAVTDDEGNIISEEYTSTEYVLNDDYDENMEYIPRSKRKEWDAVICYGQVVVRDDGTCVPDGFCKPNDSGVATSADDGFYVMDRVDEGNILIFVR